MVFSSLLFLFRFLPFVLLAYYAVPKKWQNLVLLAFSLFFYAWGEPVYVALIVFSIMVDYTAGRAVAYFKAHGMTGHAKFAVFCSASINLLLLGFFKYADFFLGMLHDVFSLEVSVLGLALPVGISFYTFQTMSYTIDVYRGDAAVQKNPVSFGAYVALFPQLIAGPIIRYKTIAKQIDSRKESVGQFYYGMIRFMAGLGKKVLLANPVGMLWEEVAATGAGQLTTAAAWLGLLAFHFQIYFDFSGYSDMAIGLGAMFGFAFPENFLHPYESKSITEFWRRWHVSLGMWFKEYVYIPLGGNRKGQTRQMANIAIVWLLTGLWHGASMNFVLWGVYFGVLLVIEKIVWKRFFEKVPAWAGHVYTMAAVIAGWYLFAWQDMEDGMGYLKAMLFHAGAGLADQRALYLLLSNGMLLAVAAIGATSAIKRLVSKYLPDGSKRQIIMGNLFVAAVFMACLAMLVNNSYNPFLYFRF